MLSNAGPHDHDDVALHKKVWRTEAGGLSPVFGLHIDDRMLEAAA